MIHLFNTSTADKKSFYNSDDFFEFIKGIENAKLSEDHPEFGSFGWSFKVFDRRSIFELYHNIKEESLTPSIREAYEQQFDLLEICKGDLSKPIHIPITPDVDVKYFQKLWCFEYCRSRGYEVREDSYHQNNANNLSLTEKKGGHYVDC